VFLGFGSADLLGDPNGMLGIAPASGLSIAAAA